jgi:16S rRNA (cytosine967-C5)-methyltransferase
VTRGGKTFRGHDTARTRAVAVLREVLEKGGRATALLSERERGLPEADRGLLRELVLGVLRWKDALDAEVAGMSRVPLAKLAPNLREILEVGLYQIRHLDRVPDYAAVSEAVEHARASGGEGAARLVNGVLRGILLLPAPSAPTAESDGGAALAAAGVKALAVYYSHPPFLVERWRRRFGDEATRRILETDNRASGLDLMTNPGKTDRAALAAALSADGIRTQPSALSPLALTVLSGNPFASPLFAAGHFSLQDVGSQALPLLLPVGETLLDLAAAPGGKSFAALALGRCRRSVAADRSVARLRLVEENRRRQGLLDVRPIAGDLLAPPFSPGRFDRVLLDAPCSGTGTLRKNPEIRYRVTPEAVERLAGQQEKFLAAAAELLSPGGCLLYSTCSLEEEENERVVSRVLARDSRLSLAEIEPPPGLGSFVEGARFRLLPDETADGFTAHLLRRR